MVEMTSTVEEVLAEVGPSSPLGDALLSIVEKRAVTSNITLLNVQVYQELQVKLEGLEAMLCMSPYLADLADSSVQAYLSACLDQLRGCCTLAEGLEVQI
jgi:hypothetical protein